MSTKKIKDTWLKHYSIVPEQLEQMKKIGGVASAFNTNIDAVCKIKPTFIKNLINERGIDEADLLTIDNKIINTPIDIIKGFINCFKNGIAEEWVVTSIDTFKWMQQHLIYDKLQMGGQGGIIANVMTLCDIQNVYVHAASISEDQSGLFIDEPNLLSVDSNGKLKKATSITREDDISLIHWILEFDKGDTLEIAGQVFTCPKANRFIATYDPLNFELHINPGFDRVLCYQGLRLNYILLSGYHLLRKTLPDGTSGIDRIHDSMSKLKKWKRSHPLCIVHLEFASTQDIVIRKSLAKLVASKVDSIGCNEQELIDILEIIGETDLADECRKQTNSINLFKGLLKLFDHFKCPRIQLHMFGLYVTIVEKDFPLSPVQIKNGMLLAATIAASKAKTGNIDIKENLLKAHGEKVADIALDELFELADYLDDTYGNNNELKFSGVYSTKEFELIVTPTILIEKPLTLVGMGDTISSVSLVGAR